MSELELLKSGDKKLIESIYKECYRSISKWVKRNSGSEKEAEDLFHDAMIVVYQKSVNDQLVLSCKLSTFIFSVAKKIWLSKLRTKGRYVSTDFTSEEELSSQEETSADQCMEDSEIDGLYQKSFKKLSKECQELLTHFFNGLSIDMIVEKMGLSTSNQTRKKKFRCKNELVRLVESDPIYVELVEK